jgi:LysM repeat protein
MLAPRETSAALLYITPAATLDINATVTAYAEGIIPTSTPSGMYIVKSGDTLSVIADDFSTTVEEIMVVNDISSPELIQVGQTLIIPTLVDRTPLPAPTFGPQDTPTIEPTLIPTATPVTVATATP